MSLKRREYDNLPEFSKDVYSCLEKMKKSQEQQNKEIDEIRDAVENLERKVDEEVIVPFKDLLSALQDLNGFIHVVKVLGKIILWISGIVLAIVGLFKGLK